MKKLLMILSAILGMALISIAGGKEKLTLKEKIDKAKTVKVYVDFQSITHNPNTQKGTGCTKFNDKTEFTSDYKNEVDNIIKKLNEGLSTDAFIKGDISTVPIKTFSNISMYDYAKMEGEIAVSLTFSGMYKTTKGSTTDPNVIYNAMNFQVDVVFMEIINGRIKVIKQGKIAFVNGGINEDSKCGDFAYFTSSFPLEKYVDEFKKSIDKKTTNITAAIMKKHNKVVEKRK